MSSALLGARLLLSAAFIRSGQECRERTVGLTVRKCKRFVVAAALVAGMALAPTITGPATAHADYGKAIYQIATSSNCDNPA